MLFRSEQSSAVDEASCLVGAVHAHPYPTDFFAHLRALRGSKFPHHPSKPPRMARISRMPRIKFLHPRDPRNPRSHRIENNRNDTAFGCFRPEPRGWKPRPPAFAEPSAGRPAAVPSDIETAERSSVVDEASCLVSAPSTPAVTHLISSRILRALRGSKFPHHPSKPPRMARISRMTRIRYFHPCSSASIREIGRAHV